MCPGSRSRRLERCWDYRKSTQLVELRRVLQPKVANGVLKREHPFTRSSEGRRAQMADPPGTRHWVKLMESPFIEAPNSFAALLGASEATAYSNPTHIIRSRQIVLRGLRFHFGQNIYLFSFAICEGGVK